MSNELSAQDLLPPEIGLTLLGFEQSEQCWLVRAEGRTRSECPSCGTQSTARHSRYWRQLQDLPVQGKRVALQLRLSRWRCCNRECEHVWVPGSRQFKDFEEYLLPQASFSTLHQAGQLPIAVDPDGETYLRDRLALLKQKLHEVDSLAARAICLMPK